MAPPQVWLGFELAEREKVFEALVSKALTLSARSLLPHVSELLTAAAAPGVEPEPAAQSQAFTVALTQLGGVQATWSQRVDAELYPYLVQTFLDAANDAGDVIERRTGKTTPKLTWEYASSLLTKFKTKLLNLGAWLWQKLSGELLTGYGKSEGAQQLAGRVRTAALDAAPVAHQTAGDVLGWAVTLAELGQLEAAGFTDADVEKEWLSADDDRVRPAHREADEQRVPLTQSFTVGGEKLIAPRDPAGRPDNVIGCRCSLGYIFKTAESDSSVATANAGPLVAHGDGSHNDKDHGRRGVGQSTSDNPFTILPKHLRGRSGDGRYAPGMIGKYGGAGVMMRHVDADGTARYLVVQRTGGGGGGSWRWQLPGGARDEKETAAQAAAREVSEEVGATPDVLSSLTLRGEYRVELPVEGKAPWTYTSLAADIPATFKPKIDYGELGAARWLTYEQLAEMRGRGRLITPFAEQLDHIVAQFDAPLVAGFYVINVTTSNDQEGYYDLMTAASDPDWDESKVKRDSEGKFAKKAGSKVGKPIHINTAVIYKTKYADGAVVAVKPGAMPQRLRWSETDKKFWLQTQHAAGHWQTLDKFGKGAAYKKFSQESGWHAESPVAPSATKQLLTPPPPTPATAPPPVFKTDKVSSIPDLVDLSQAELNSWFEGLSQNQYDALTPADQEHVAQVAATESSFGNDKPKNSLKVLDAGTKGDSVAVAPQQMTGDDVDWSDHTGPSLNGVMSIKIKNKGVSGGDLATAPLVGYLVPQPGTQVDIYDLGENFVKSIDNESFYDTKQKIAELVNAGGGKIQAPHGKAPAVSVSVDPSSVILNQDISKMSHSEFEQWFAKHIYKFGDTNNFSNAGMLWALSFTPEQKQKMRARAIEASNAGLPATRWAIDALDKGVAPLDPNFGNTLDDGNDDEFGTTPSELVDPVPTTSPTVPAGPIPGGKNQLSAYAHQHVTPASDIGTPSVAPVAAYPVLTKAHVGSIQKSMLSAKGKTWTSAEVSAVQRYTTSVGYQTTNAVLRNDVNRMKMFSVPQLQDGVKNAIDLQSAMTPTTAPFRVFRGTGAHAFGGTDVDMPLADLKKLEGKTITDRGFVSTTFLDVKSTSYDYTKKPIFIELDVPEGTPGLFVSEATPSWSSENEFIIAAGSSYLVQEVRQATAADKAKHGQHVDKIVRMRVVPGGAHPAPTPKVNTPATPSVTPSSSVTPKKLSATPGKVPPAGKPIKINTAVIYKTKYDHGAVVAVRTQAGVSHRLVWHANNKKFVLQTLAGPANSPTWQASAAYGKGEAYSKFSPQIGWTTPTPGDSALGTPGFTGTPPTVAPSPSPTSAPSVGVAPAAPSVAKSSKFSVADLLALYGVPPVGPTSTTANALFQAFKHPPSGAFTTINTHGPMMLHALLDAVDLTEKSYGVKINLLQALKIIDTKSTPVGKTNANLYEKKLVDWLQTATGATTAAKIIDQQGKSTSTTPAATDLQQELASVPTPASFGTPKNVPQTDFKTISVDDATEMQAKLWAVKPLTPQQRSAINDYTGAGFTSMNQILRKKKPPTPGIVDKIKQMQSAMQPLPRTVITYRGVDGSAFGFIGKPSLSDIEKMIGSTITDHGFVSTSTLKSKSFNGNIKLRIEAPAGTPAIYVKTISNHPSESELIYAAGTKFKITAVTQGSTIGLGTINVTLRVVA